jgi:hypothetical protein
MPAERCRPAVLDRRHHLELAEADMAGVGLAPRRSMAAEDIRNLQPWMLEQRRASGWRLDLGLVGRVFGVVPYPDGVQTGLFGAVRSACSFRFS